MSVVSTRLGPLRALLVGLHYPLALIAFALLWLACAFDRLVPLPLPFPRHPAALARRRAWCLARLERAGALPPAARVTRYEVRPFGQGEVFRSTLAELTIGYELEGRAHTLECIAKFAAQFGTISAQVISILQRNQLNEIELYRSYGGTPHVLRAHYAKVAGLAGQFCLLVERVRPAHQVTEEAGAPLPTAREVVAMYARFHARHWRRDPRARRPRAPIRVPPLSIDFLCSLAWGLHRRLSRRLARGAWHHGNRAQTIVHGDARVRNLIFRGTRDGAPVDPIFIDWQATRWGLGAYDLAYFLLVSLTPETRAAHERELVDLYHRELVAHGVGGYDRDAFEEDYRHSVLLVFSLLFLPLLGGEQTLDEHNRAAATAIAMSWHERVVRALETFDRTFVASRYGIDTEAFRVSAEWIADHPHPLNSGARLVATEKARRARTAR